MHDSETPPPSDQPVETLPPHFLLQSTVEAYLLCGLLFLLTCFSTFLAGIGAGGPEPTEFTWRVVWDGVNYAGPLMLILLCHEMGHYLQARRHGVPATLPFFIPTPQWLGVFGTMGAIIVQDGTTVNRRSLFDIAVSGPLAGLFIALLVTWYGVQHSEVMEIPEPPPGKVVIRYGDPLLLQAMVYVKHGTLPPKHDVIAGPLFFAGWIGLLLTGLNLLPIGQLDGGHVMYALIGKRAYPFALIAWLALIAYMIYAQYWGYVVFAGLLAFMGLFHPPTTDDEQPLGSGRVIVGWLTMGLLLICFIPQPVQFHFGPELPPEDAQTAPAE